MPLPSFSPPDSSADSRLLGLYVLTHHAWGGGHESIARASLRAGARIIQLRDKSSSPAELEAAGRALRTLTRDFGALLLVNDDPRLALAIGADGVHLGPDDASPQQARAILGSGSVIGVSCGTVEEAQRAFAAGASYIGAGAIFGTATKADAGDAIGLESLRAIAAATPLPVAAIGGVEAANIAQLPSCGARMACVVSAIARAGDEAAMEQAARSLRLAFEAALPESPAASTW
jgi:thiamine-phosphate diphosphorylase